MKFSPMLALVSIIKSVDCDNSLTASALASEVVFLAGGRYPSVGQSCSGRWCLVRGQMAQFCQIVPTIPTSGSFRRINLAFFFPASKGGWMNTYSLAAVPIDTSELILICNRYY